MLDLPTDRPRGSRWLSAAATCACLAFLAALHTLPEITESHGHAHALVAAAGETPPRHR